MEFARSWILFDGSCSMESAREYLLDGICLMVRRRDNYNISDPEQRTAITAMTTTIATAATTATISYDSYNSYGSYNGYECKNSYVSLRRLQQLQQL